MSRKSLIINGRMLASVMLHNKLIKTIQPETNHSLNNMTLIKLLKRPTTSTGESWYQDARLNRLARINGGRLFGEKTMLDMLGDGSLIDHWTIPDEELFGATPEYLAQYE